MQEHTFSETIDGRVIEATYQAENTKHGVEVTVFYGGRRKVIYDGSRSTERARRLALVDLVREAGE